MKKIILSFIFLIAAQLFSAQGDTNYEKTLKDFMLFKKNVKIDPKNKSVLNVLNAMYDETLQSDAGILSDRTAKEYDRLLNESNVPNQQVLYLYKKYQTYIAENSVNGKKPDAEYQLNLVKLLAGESIYSLDNLPKIVAVFMAESLISSGNYEAAKNNIDLSLKRYPDSIPLNVYKYYLNKENNIKLKEKLLKEHPNHWMVQSFVR
ncbi:hypothetical protein [Chryseobacterium sp.]|uniref:hypothetical protein n=1 Tax=Chryseobacterium sp. TaxID=1871047 RepID=UPI0011CAE207|nr:hypothetical protein [Chryseobacterium sp.]TXF74906.1 hypothetical protein FUA25_11500 [Chryseobacterium sp.]